MAIRMMGAISMMQPRNSRITLMSQRQQDRVVGHAGDGVGRQIRHVQGGHAVAEHVRGGDQDQDDGQGVDSAVQLFPDALQVQALARRTGPRTGVEHGDGGRLGGGEPAGGNAHDHG